MSNNLNEHADVQYDKEKIIEQLNIVIDESEKMSKDVLGHLEVVLDKLDELTEGKNLQSNIDGIKNNIFTTMSSMQAQDFHIQRIQRVLNDIDPNSCNAPSAKHIAGDCDTTDIVDADELEALIAQMGNN